MSRFIAGILSASHEAGGAAKPHARRIWSFQHAFPLEAQTFEIKHVLVREEIQLLHDSKDRSQVFDDEKGPRLRVMQRSKTLVKDKTSTPENIG
jgi:hypothetical protein